MSVGGIKCSGGVVKCCFGPLCLMSVGGIKCRREGGCSEIRGLNVALDLCV